MSENAACSGTSKRATPAASVVTVPASEFSPLPDAFHSARLSVVLAGSPPTLYADGGSADGPFKALPSCRGRGSSARRSARVGGELLLRRVPCSSGPRFHMSRTQPVALVPRRHADYLPARHRRVEEQRERVVRRRQERAFRRRSDRPVHLGRHERTVVAAPVRVPLRRPHEAELRRGDREPELLEPADLRAPDLGTGWVAPRSTCSRSSASRRTSRSRGCRTPSCRSASAVRAGSPRSAGARRPEAGTRAAPCRCRTSTRAGPRRRGRRPGWRRSTVIQT